MAQYNRSGCNRIVFLLLFMVWMGPRTGAARQLEAIEVVEDCSIPGPIALDQTNLAEDVSYGTDDPTQTFDISWPLGAGPHPLVVLVHGGAWQTGDKRDLRNDMLRLTRAGYVAASLNYRLSPAHIFPAALNDVQCALQHLQNDADRYAIDTEQVLVIGASAGGHLATLMAMGTDVKDLQPTCPEEGIVPQITGVVAYYTPTDVRDPSVFGTTESNALIQFLGESPHDNPALGALASPVTHVRAENPPPPMLMIHGEADNRVPFQQSTDLQAVLWDAGVPSTVVGLPDIQHGFPIFAGTDELRPGACTALAFLQHIVSLDASAPRPPDAFGLTLTAPFPNPTQDWVQMEITTPSPSPVRVQVYDAIGRRVAVVHEGGITPYRAQPIRFSTVGWPTGMYWVRVEGGGVSQTRAFIRR